MLLGIVKKELRNELLMRKSVSRGIILPGGNELDMSSPVYVRALGKLALSQMKLIRPYFDALSYTPYL